MTELYAPEDTGFAAPPFLLYHPDFLKYDFGGSHALREVRLRLARDLIVALGLAAPAREVAPVAAGIEDVSLVHDPAYVKAVSRLSRDPRVPEPDFGLEAGDNPPFAGMLEAALLQVGATIRACTAVATGEATRAYNLGGGFHHAQHARAAGFCVFNDVAIGIRRLLDKGMRRIAYVDIDAHHGDGVQAMFYRDPRVLTISLHEDGHYLFPGTGAVEEIGESEGRGFAANVPLPPGTGDKSWTMAFDAVVPPLLKAFRPEILVTQTGADAHALDPLTHLKLTTESYEHAGARFDELTRRVCGQRWVAVGGGGYEVTAAPRVWTLLFGTMVRRRPGNALPADWLAECRSLVRAEPRDGTLRDASLAIEESHITRVVRKTVDRVQELVFPYHSISS